MRITKISIENIMGIKSLEFEAGKFNEITGDNGTGKTSVLEAMKSIFRGGHDATLLRKGESAGRTVLHFDDGRIISKDVFADESVLDVGEKQPATFIKRISNLASVNPVALLTANKEKRLEILLKSIPFDFNWAELRAITGIAAVPSDNPLGVIAYQRERFYKDRTRVNAELEKAKSYIASFEVDIPTEPETSYADTIEALEADKRRFESVRDTAKSEAEKIKAAKTQELNAILQAAIAEANERYRAEMADVTSEHFTSIQDADRIYAEAVTPVNDNLAKAHEAEKNVAVIQDKQRTLAKMKDDAYHTQQESEDYTRIIKAIDAMKANLLTNIPIKGLDILDGEVYIDGVEWDRVNEARRIQIAIQIAELAAGELKIILVDGLERFDAKTYALFKENALATDCQFFVTCVEDHSLEVANEDLESIFVKKEDPKFFGS
jgi:energy-coupling factor transporter ATP-binding protein EcfA2